MININFIQGILIGIAKIIPGFSGAVLMMSFNLYDKAIDAITNFFDDVKHNFFFLFRIGIGVLIGVVLFSRVIVFFINHYFLYTYMFFIGLILGGVPVIGKKISYTKNNIIFIFISFLIVFLLSIFHINYQYIPQHNVSDVIIFYIAGILEALGTVVPGISSTALLMLMGVYQYYITIISHFFISDYFFDNIFFLLPFSLGVIMGVIVISLLIHYLFCHYKGETFSVILGFSMSSIFLIIIKLFPYFDNIFSIIFSICFMALGFVITHKMQ